jgi:hypothetical protein
MRLTSPHRSSAAVIYTLFTAIVGGALLAPALARPTRPTPDDRTITLAVVKLMEVRHLTGQRLDDTVSPLPGIVRQRTRSAQVVLSAERRR